MIHPYLFSLKINFTILDFNPFSTLTFFTMLKNTFLFLSLAIFSLNIGKSQSAISTAITGSTDDAEEYLFGPNNDPFRPEGSMDITSSDIELGAENPAGVNPQISGLRFTGLKIPKGAMIQSATIEFTVDATNKNEDPSELYVFAQDNPNPATFSASDFDITSRLWLEDSVLWNPGAWSTVGERHQTSDISQLVQTLVNQDGWSSGNAMAFFIKGSGVREAESYEGNAADAAVLNIEYIVLAETSFQIASSTDDAEEYLFGPNNDPFRPEGSMDITSSDIELGAENPAGVNPQISGLRFAGINLPKGVNIQSAYIEFTVDATTKNEDPTELYIFAQDAANPATFSSNDFDITSRTWLEDSTAWNPGTWNTVGETHQTSDISNLVQSLVSQDGWSSGNAMAFFIRGIGVREAESFDGSAADAARLVITYEQEEIIFTPEVVKEIPDNELVSGWDFYLDVKPFFRDQDSELSFNATSTGQNDLPAWLSFSNGILEGTFTGTGSFPITVYAISEGDSIADEFLIEYINAPGDFTLAIFHNNDGESDLLPDSIVVNGQPTTGGSIGQFKATLDSLRQQAAMRDYYSMLLSSGDNFLAGLEYNASQANNIYYDAVAIDSLDYDALALGNHDFDFGTQVLAEFVQAVEKNQPPFLSANLGFENVPELQALVEQDRIRSSVILDKDGEKIGVFGLIYPQLQDISSPGNTTISPAIVDSAQAEINNLTAEGVNKIILISHLQDLDSEISLIGQLSGIDIVIAGGGDELLSNDPTKGDPYSLGVAGPYPVKVTDNEGDTVYVVTTPGNYRYLGQLLVSFNSAGEVVKVFDAQSDLVLVTGKTNQDLVEQIEEPIRDYIGDLSTNVVANVEDTLDFRRESLRFKETNGGNLFADALLWQAQQNFESFGVNEPQVALQNSGGLRIESLVLPGPFTEDLTYEIAAFTNILSVVEDISPAKFLQLMEHGVAKSPELDGRFPQIAGFKIIYDQGLPEGNRIQSITLDDGTKIVENSEPVNGAPLLNLATIDFTANGGDGYPFSPLDFTTLGTTYQQAFLNYLTDGLNGQVTEEEYPLGMNERIIVELSEPVEIVSPILLMETFDSCDDSGFPPAWTRFSVSSDADWDCSDDTRGESGESGDYSAEINGFGANEASEDWLITPALDFGGNPHVLSFSSDVRFDGPGLEILFSADYSGTGNPDNATWVNLPEAEAMVDPNTGSFGFVSSGMIELPDSTGEVYIAFKYTTTGTGPGDGALNRIDNVVVKSMVLYSEDFDAVCGDDQVPFSGIEFDPAGIINCTSSGASGQPGDFAFQGNGFGVSAGQGWIITPKLDFSTGDYVLNFDSEEDFSGPEVQVLYSTDYSGIGDPAQATWTNIPAAEDAIGSDNYTNSGDIDLSFLNGPAYIAFLYTSDGTSGGQSTRWNLDNIAIMAPGEVDTEGFVSIPEIQGDGFESPFANTRLSTGGIVTAVFNGPEPYSTAGYSSDLGGFYIQSPDGNPTTSDGLFVALDIAVQKGDSIMVYGVISENFGLTQMSEVDSVKVLGSNYSLPMVTNVNLPLASDLEFEKYEGMLVNFAGQLTVTENRLLDNFGELRLSAGGRLYQPTQLVDPNDNPKTGNTASGNSNVSEVTALQELNNLRSIILDDAREGSFNAPIPYLNANNTILAGTTVDDLTGIFTYGFGAYRLQPTESPSFNYEMREDLPQTGGSLKVVAFNVLNYFNGDGMGGGFPTSRGASSLKEFSEQSQKIVAALQAIDGDVVGLIEIENDADDGKSAIKTLTDSLNKAMGAGTYDFISTGIIERADGTADEIKVAFIYKPATVNPVGDYAILNNDFDPNYYDNFSRPALAQTFEEKSSGGIFTAAVNHFKSKGSDCDELGDPNDNDGQGNCNVTRTSSAGTLASWLATDPTGSGDEDFMILGDLNAYAQEDPIDTLRSRGYVNLTPDSAYSYVFDGQYGTLDYGMVNESLYDQVTGAAIWHINSVEPDLLSYRGIDSLFASSPYWSSDHDPVIVGLKLEQEDEPVCGAIRVVSFKQGKRRNNRKISKRRSDPNNALALPQENNFYNFVSLGFGGSITLEFGEEVYDDGSAEPEIILVETSFGRADDFCFSNGRTSYPEQAYVEVSHNGMKWYSLPNSYCRTSFLDIKPAVENGMPFAKYIRITDSSNKNEFGGNADGFDVDGVIICPDEVLLVQEQLTNARLADNNGIGLFDPAFINKAPNEPEGMSIAVFPNPIERKIVRLSIETGNQEMIQVSIYDVAGKVEVSKNYNISSHSNNLEINVNNLNKGIYIMQVKAGEGSYQQKIVIP